MKRVLYALLTVCLFSLASSATPITYSAFLSGPNESPANNSAGTGLATVVYDSTAHTLGVTIDFSGLGGTTTASHIHCCTVTPFSGTAGVATQTPTFVNFPLGVTSGHYSNVFDLTNTTTWNSAFLGVGGTTAAELALGAALNSGQSYLNIHTSLVPGGEIRGFLVPGASAVPEPSSLILLGTGIFGVAATVRKRARRLTR